MNKNRFLFFVATAFFFFSGSAGLIYEVIWFKRFAIVWGSSTAAMACVVASFLAGLGLGAHFYGNRADRIKVPLLHYGVFEVAIGILALLMPWEIALLQKAASLAYPFIGDYPIIHSIFRLGLTFVAIGPPCILMGATLPLLVSQLSKAKTLGSLPIAWLYAINTLGAAMGCFAAGFYLLPTIGLNGTNLLAVALNMGIGIASLLLSLKLRSRAVSSMDNADTMSKEELPAPLSPGIPLHILHIVVFLSGCAALMLQIAWTRQLTVMLGGSTYAFSAMLFVFLLGIGLGSLAYELASARIQRHLPIFLSICILVLIASVAAGKKFIPDMSAIVGLLRPIRAEHLSNAMVCITFSAAIQFIPAIILGILFPLYAQLAKATFSTAGQTVAKIYVCNTWGTILGASLTGLALIPRFGTVGIVTIALLLFTVVLVLIAVVVSETQRRVMVAITFLCLLSVFAMGGKFDPRDTDKGKFMYGYTPVSTFKDKVLYYQEGSACNVLVTDSDGHRALRVNGKVDASNRGDMNMQLGLAYIPRLLRPSSENVLVIGFGSGTTSGASLLFENTKVDCCEIEPAVYRASEYFSDVNHSPHKSENFRIIFDDARAYIQGVPKQYDLILSEPSNPWIAGVSTLFTQEFYREAKRKLRPNGILAQWIQTYSFSADAYRAVMQTASSVFPYCALVKISDGDTILLTSQEPFSVDQQTLSLAHQLIGRSPAVAHDLKTYFATTNVVDLLLRHVLLSESAVQQIVGKINSDLVITDFNLRLEFDTPHLLFNSDATEKRKIVQMLAQAADPEWFKQLAQLSANPKQHLDSLNEVSKWMVEQKADSQVASILELGLSFDPDNVGMLLKKAARNTEWDDSYLIARAETLAKSSLSDANKFGVIFWKNSQYRLASLVFEAVVAKDPKAITAWVNLGINREALGEFQSAEEAYKQALAISPSDDFAKGSYDAFLKKSREQKQNGKPLASIEHDGR